MLPHEIYIDRRFHGPTFFIGPCSICLQQIRGKTCSSSVLVEALVDAAAKMIQMYWMGWDKLRCSALRSFLKSGLELYINYKLVLV